MKTILDTEIIKVFLTNEGYVPIIKMEGDNWLEHMPFPANLQGLVNAMQLATECCAGKFYPKRIYKKSDVAKLAIAYNKLT